MLGKYERIDKVIYNDGTEAFLLTHNGADVSGFEVDLKSDFWFNGVEIVKRETIKTVDTLEEVVRFCKENDIKFDTCYDRLEENILKVGGEADCFVYDNLEYGWMVE